MTMPARNFPNQGVPRSGPAGRMARVAQATGPVTGGPVNAPPTTSNFGSAPARSLAGVSQAVNSAAVAPASEPAPSQLSSVAPRAMAGQYLKKGGAVKKKSGGYASGSKIDLGQCKVSTASRNKKNSNW